MKEKILTREIVEKLGLNKVSVITADMLAEYTSIGFQAFEGCHNLTSVTIGDSITSIGVYAFANCLGLTSVMISNSVMYIESSAFYYCIHLTSIEIPNSVTNIGSGAFEDCTSLTSVTIPNNGINIGISAFGYCTSLTSVTIGDKTYKLQTVTDSKCKAYKAFNSDMTCRGFQYKEGELYELDGTPKLCEHGFHACLCLTDVFNYYCGKLGKGIHIHEVELESISDERMRFESKIVAKKITIGKRIL